MSVDNIAADMKIMSAYIHFPFCVKKCPYCDFVSYAGCLDKKEAYIKALCREIDLTAKEQEIAESLSPLQGCDGPEASGTNHGLATIYMGGGTPSLFSPEELGIVIQAIRENFGIQESAEITMEVNPGTVSREAFLGYRAIGVNRISIGVQSFSQPILASLGRIHTSGQAVEAIHMAQAAGFTNISCDLMTGLAGQSLTDVEDSLAMLLEYRVPHVSFYALIIEEGTPFFEKYESHEELLPTPDLERSMYHMMLARLKAEGYVHYEISNCGKPGFESRHNMTYWRAEPYYGFGCGAFGYRQGKRTGNTKDLSAYIQAMTGPPSDLSAIVTESEEIDKNESRKEFMLLGFRMMAGISSQEFAERYGVGIEEVFGRNLQMLLSKDLIVHEKDRYFLSEKGIDYANEVFREFVGN